MWGLAWMIFGLDYPKPETNSKFAPENGWLEDDPFPFWGKRPIFRPIFSWDSLKEFQTLKTWLVYMYLYILGSFVWGKLCR